MMRYKASPLRAIQQAPGSDHQWGCDGDCYADRGPVASGTRTATATATVPRYRRTRTSPRPASASLRASFNAKSTPHSARRQTPGGPSAASMSREQRTHGVHGMVLGDAPDAVGREAIGVEALTERGQMARQLACLEPRQERGVAGTVRRRRAPDDRRAGLGPRDRFDERLVRLDQVVRGAVRWCLQPPDPPDRAPVARCPAPTSAWLRLVGGLDVAGPRAGDAALVVQPDVQQKRLVDHLRDTVQRGAEAVRLRSDRQGESSRPAGPARPASAGVLRAPYRGLRHPGRAPWGLRRSRQDGAAVRPP